jgi:hypothetical protein
MPDHFATGYESPFGGGLVGGRATWAGPDDLYGVGYIDKVVVPSRLGGPALDLWSFDFNCNAAVTADQVVMMVNAGAASVSGFAIVAS